MKSALKNLESQFESMLDNYCLAMESGRGIEAAMVSIEAEDYLEAIEVLKLTQGLEEIAYEAA